MNADVAIPAHANACLMLADGKLFFGTGIGAEGMAGGEICFNTAMTGYQEVLTDPSYACQIVTFTFPHIGNTGCNDEDIEAHIPHAAGLVVRELPTPPSSFRSRMDFDAWLKKHDISGICGVDTRALTRYIRTNGAQNAVIVSGKSQVTSDQLKKAQDKLKSLPDMTGCELADTVTTKKPYEWTQGVWRLSPATGHLPLATAYHVVAIDYGEKLNILRSLAERGCKVTVVSASTGAEEILALRPDGIFLSNGPGDPAATGKYAIAVLKKLIASEVPVFGICLGHQLLALALGCETEKMHQGHRGANHPVKNLKTGTVEITSQNHGFCVRKDKLPPDVEVTHLSLFDGCLEGLRHKIKPVFSVQYHPESSPGPHDSQYLFDEFVEMMNRLRASGSGLREKRG